MTNDTSVVQAVIDEYIQTFNRHDARGHSETFAEDAEFTNVFGRRAVGRKAIEQHHAPLFTEPQIPGVPSFIPARLTVLESRIRLLREDVAVADVNWRLTGAIAGNGQPWGDRTGIISAVLTREDGRWLIAAMHNMDLPQPPA